MVRVWLGLEVESGCCIPFSYCWYYTAATIYQVYIYHIYACTFLRLFLNDDQQRCPMPCVCFGHLHLTANATVFRHVDTQMITTAMGVFSVYLLSLLKFKIGYPCPWCLTSVGVTDWSNGRGGQCLVLNVFYVGNNHDVGIYRTIVMIMPRSRCFIRLSIAFVLKPQHGCRLGEP